MAVVAALVAAERLLPGAMAPAGRRRGPRRARRVGVALAPGDVPGLTVPGSEMAMDER